MTTNDHFPTDFEMMDDMAEFGVENAAELAALDRRERPSDLVLDKPE
jgi:hypothetical protein